ncbi:MAG: hypothetical protein M3273_08840 [Actinomycetota bacterium]|nr:hypothetical protein [Actinomycetota bacterium]
MRPMLRDERALITSWLIRLLVGLALVGVVLFDAGSIVVNYLSLDSTADEIAVSVSTLVGSGSASVPNAKCDRRSGLQICREVQELAREAGARLVEASFDSEGVFHLTVRRAADTLIVERIGAIEDWGRATASARAATN